jgi:hypothetical protein
MDKVSSSAQLSETQNPSVRLDLNGAMFILFEAVSFSSSWANWSFWNIYVDVAEILEFALHLAICRRQCFASGNLSATMLCIWQFVGDNASFQAYCVYADLQTKDTPLVLQTQPSNLLRVLTITFILSLLTSIDVHCDKTRHATNPGWLNW